MTNESTNETTKSQLKPTFVLYLSFACIFCPINIFAMFIVISSRLKLVKVEFFLLSWNLILLSCDKLEKIWFFSHLILLNLNMIPLELNIANQTIEFLFSFCYFMSLLYYSLFHLSTLNRSKYFLKLYNVLHESKTFIIYSISILTLATTYSVSIALICYYKIIYAEIGEDLRVYTFILLGHPFESNVISVLPILVYLMAILLVLHSRLNCCQILNQNASSENQNRFKRNLVLVGKFFILTIIQTLATFPKNFSHLLLIFCPASNCQLGLIELFYIIGYAILSIQPVFIVFVHTILRSTLSSLIRRLFSL